MNHLLSDLEQRQIQKIATQQIQPHFGQRKYDAVWAGRDTSGEPFIRGLLQISRLETMQRSVLAWASVSEGQPRAMRWIPTSEIVWLLHGPSAPAREARMPEQEPVFMLPGEDNAFRLRCLAGADAVAMVKPSEIIQKLDGLELDLHLRSPNSDALHCGYTDRRFGSKLLVEHHDQGGLRESSAGLSLAIWFLSTKQKDVRILDWKEVPAMEAERHAGFLSIFNTYQALRLPGLRLLLELRATSLPRSVFLRQFADEYRLPYGLVERRIHELAALCLEATWP